MVNVEMLDSKIVESGKTKTHLSKRLGISLQTFKRKCTGKSNFLLSEVDTLCTELDIKTLTELKQIFLSNK